MKNKLSDSAIVLVCLSVDYIPRKCLCFIMSLYLGNSYLRFNMSSFKKLSIFYENEKEKKKMSVSKKNLILLTNLCRNFDWVCKATKFSVFHFLEGLIDLENG